MTAPNDAQARAAATYNAAADRYDDPANSFWERFGRSTIERLRPETGSRILDVCCGSGASALPAAEMVGPQGFVLGVDLAANLLHLARRKAAACGLHNAEFRLGDMLDLRLGQTNFDAVVCVFGIFFVPDMRAAVHSLWQAVRPGGRLAVTTWGPRFFEPATSAFWNAVREVRPDLYKGFNPWDRICDPESLSALLRECGIERAEVVAEARRARDPISRGVVVGSPRLRLPRDARATGLRGTRACPRCKSALHTFVRYPLGGSQCRLCDRPEGMNAALFRGAGREGPRRDASALAAAWNCLRR